MTNSPEPENQAKTSNWRLKRLLFGRVSIAIGIPLLLGLAAGAWWLRMFIYEQLAPLVAKNLTQTLKRPVKIGRVERFYPNGLRFGATSVPATKTDPDRVSIESVEVAFNPLQLLFTRTLNLDVTLVNPNIYIQQDAQGRWVNTAIAQSEESGPFQIVLDKLRLRNADATIVSNVRASDRPSPQNTVALNSVDGIADFQENYQLINFNLDGQLKRGGTLGLVGDFRPKTGRADINVKTKNFLASDLTRLIKLPLNLQGGRIDSDLKAQLTPEKLIGLYGSADLQSVTAQANQLPQPFYNSTGRLGFQGTKIILDNVSSSYGKIPAIANGSLDTVGNYNLTAQVKAVNVAAVDTFKLQLPVPVTGVFRSNVKLTGPIVQPVLTGSVANIKPVRIDKLNFKQASADFTLATAKSTLNFQNIQATPTVGGKVTGNGNIKLALKPGQQTGLNFNIIAQNVPGDAIAKTYGVNTSNVTIGSVSALAQVSGTPENPRTDVNWQAPQATYPGQGKLIIYNANNLILRDTVLRVASGTVFAAGQLINRRWQANLQANGIRLGRLTEVPPSLQSPVSGFLNLSGSADSFQPEQITATGSGRLSGIGGGTITASNILVTDGRWQTQLQASGVQLQRLAAVPPQLRGDLTGKFNLSGITTAFTPKTIRATGQGRLSNVAGGTVTATNIQLASGQWQLALNASQVQLNQFNQQLKGQLNGELKLAGTVDAFSPAGIRAAGTVRFSEDLIGQPLVADLRWDGDKLIIPQATSPNLFASGIIDVETNQGVSISGLNLNLRVQDYNLRDIPVQLPSGANVAGRADFSGKITGNLPTPNVAGALQLENLVVNNVAFDPILAGNVQLVPGRGLNLDLTGNQSDRVAVNLNPNYRPNSFLVRLDEAVARGNQQGENLLVNVENFPLQLLNLRPPNNIFGFGQLRGILSADLQVNIDKLAVAGNAAVAKPSLGQWQGNSFVAQFRYANGGGTLTSSELVKGESRYALTGSFNSSANGPQFQAKANITRGKIQDILAALQITDFEDLQRFQPNAQTPSNAGAKDLGTLQVGIPDASVLTQLRRFSEIEALLQQQRQQNKSAFTPPALSELQGTFGGDIALSGSTQTGVAANFNIQGDNWQWGKYDADRIVVRGDFENSVLTLLPLRIESDTTRLAFTGRIGTKEQSGQLRVRNFPVSALNDFVQLPVSVTGNLDATATLSGSINNPQAVGDVQLVDGTLNQNKLESASATFSYTNARFSFGSNVAIASPEPITISGSIPFELPFAAVKPDSNEIRLDVNVQDQGLALLNLFTNQVAWEGGEGQVQLQVRGTTTQPIANGIATINNATIRTTAIPERLTNVAGTARFNNDRITVEGIQGNFSNGQVIAQGVIPIFDNLASNDPDLSNPLTVGLNNLELNLEGRYQGGVNGNVVIGGVALSPVISGEVRLADGQVFLPTTNAPTVPGFGGVGGVGGAGGAGGENSIQNPKSKIQNPPSPQPPASSPSPGGATVGFKDLRLILDDDIAIVLQPILNFNATGTLNVNGTLTDLRPEGTIELTSGSVNLFTTQFELENDYENTATFTRKDDLDPILDVRLIAAVPEVTSSRVPSSPISSEIDDTLASDVGGLETVRVQAAVKGPASQLFDNLELTSTPSRNRTQIISLIGGGFVQTLGRADSAVGLANIAGSALLSTYQGTFTNIGNAFGLSEFRLFPTVSTDEERSRSSTLGLAAEAGVDISRNVYFSALKDLTTDEPAQFGLSYRVNPEIRVRASTDFSGENRAIVEYESQF